MTSLEPFAPVDLAVALTGGAVALLLQAPLIGAAAERFEGDEGEYLARAGRQGPYAHDRHAPEPFLRLPGFVTWIALLVGGARRRGEMPSPRRARWGMSLVAASVVALTALLSASIGGTPAAALSTLLLLLLAERALLAVCLWPDGMLALCAVLAVTLVGGGAGGIGRAVLLGAVLTAAVTVRIDGLAMAAGSMVAVAALGWRSEELLWCVVPPLLGLVVWTVRSRRRYGVPVPETTFAFNLAVAARELDGGSEPIERSVVEVWAHGWRDRTWSERRGAAWWSLRRLGSRPFSAAAALLRRVLVLLGPDSFGEQQLLRQGGLFDGGGGGPGLSARWRLILGAGARWETPALVGLSLAGVVAMLAGQAPAGPLPRLALLPFAAHAAACVAVHTRTRYRAPLLPLFALGGAHAVVALGDLVAQGAVAAAAAAAALGGAKTFLLVRHPARHERT
ncbi:MAG: hypothetical protein DWQ36_24630 [Acidobacteria bacterium]|nr:MAG: hypothetical protein DWQ36_24630 [Acidobacteriota bacterium]